MERSLAAKGHETRAIYYAGATSFVAVAFCSFIK